jgi:hypothetical protein
MAVIEIAKIQVRRGQEKETGVPRLDPGEFGWAEDTQNLYIGKRISEGANSDDNARVLTDKDLNNIFDLIGFGGSPAVASTSTYRYRDNLHYEKFASTTTSIARKLDNWVSLTDFTQFTLANDITEVLQLAITNLYANNYYSTSTIRALKIPAGTYTIGGVIDLPPFANLIGEGAGITTLVLNTNGGGMFRTVDALGAHYEQGMQYDGMSSKQVSLSNMTLAFNEGNVNPNALIYLDNTKDPVLENLHFTTLNADISVPTFISTGTAISLRGSIGVDESSVICRNIKISNCQIENVKVGINGVGYISRANIEKNTFINLGQGITLSSTSGTSTPLPTNFVVSQNDFKFIRQDAINVSTNTNSSNLISSENRYYYVGNGSAIPEQQVTRQGTAVLTFNAPGNISSNDYFYRSVIANNGSAPNNFYYNPLVSGNAKITNASTNNGILNPTTPNQKVFNIPLTGTVQSATVDYQLNNIYMSRSGQLILNISPDGFASVSDHYNYSESATNESYRLAFSTNMNNAPYNGGTYNYVTLTCSSFTTATTQLEFNIDLTV